ncbi:MAG: phosphatidylserine decarboxylase [Methylobacter sp.]|nr:phosphatidylserine decarboxylase [Methylobacter sp.]
MSSKSRNSAVSARRRVATAQDLMQVLKRADAFLKPKVKSLASPDATSLPPQAPMFLGDIPPVGTVYEPKQPATKKLKKIIEENYYSASFESAIKTVSAQRIPELDRIKTLDQYYYYVDELVTWIPEIRVWDWNGEILHERTCYLRITQFYYYFNQPELEALQSPVAPLKGAILSPVSLWLRDFAVEWGAFLDTPASSEYLESFKYAPEYAWQDYEKEPQQYETFNAYFGRKFKDIEVQRPVAQADDDRVIVFPAESTFVGQWTISTGVGDPLPAPPSIVVKHIEWPIEELLQDTQYKDDFAGGVFCHSFLNTYDYHRQHTPVAGKVLEAKFIPGQVYLEVNLQKLSKQEEEDENGDLAQAVIPQRYLDAEDPTGYQFVQCRGLLVLETAIGKVAVLPMGMAQVSSVVFVTPEAEGQQPIVLTPEEKEGLDYYQQVELLNKKIEQALVGKQLSKGEMFSFFQFGGSDCVVVFERKANVDVSAKVNVHYPIRSQYAISNINK